LGIGLAVFFLLGLIAAAYSSADSALTSLTTSFSIDILNIEKKHTKADQIKIRKKVHIAMSFVLLFVIVFFNYVIGDASVITKLFTFAGYTYGPLLGLYAFGLFSKAKVKDKWVPLVAIAAPLLGFVISYYSNTLFGFEFKFSILILNGFLTLLGLVLIRAKED
jgi:SSS family solute:Na+ symporter